MVLDRASCCRALDARDPRFDGVFFVGITTTGVYCRPICPARRVRRDRCRFFSTAAAAEQAGFRPCLRCRPELAPGRARVDAVPRLVEAATFRIAAGALNGRGVERLAEELGVSGRQLRRAVKQELGVSPVALAQTHRLLLAKHLLTDTRMTVARVAFTSGFQSLRRFNALFHDRYRLKPAALRARRAGDAPDVIRLTLAYRPPLAWATLLECLRSQATPGVEWVDDQGYARTVRIDGHVGVIRVERAGAPGTRRADGPARPVLQASISTSLLPVVMRLLPRIRALMDLNAEPAIIDGHLARAGLGALVRRRRGIRVPGAFDGFEIALRVLAGTLGGSRAATEHMGHLAGGFGQAVDTAHPMLTRLAVTPERLADASVGRIAAAGVPRDLATALQGLSRLVAGGGLYLSADADGAMAVRRLSEDLGLPHATAELIAMRAISWPDAFPSGDEMTVRTAEPWRPWRAYAAMHLAVAGGDSQLTGGAQ
jgi:AraC family transcriptional regulator of adaptative response / DNA-3-methyladenine glycosylase II